MLTHSSIDHDLTNHAPQGPHVVAAFEALRQPAKSFAHTILDVCPPSPERDEAYLFLQQALMFAVAAVARNQHMVDEGLAAEGSG
jgi:hypothetical protein